MDMWHVFIYGVYNKAGRLGHEIWTRSRTRAYVLDILFQLSLPPSWCIVCFSFNKITAA